MKIEDLPNLNGIDRCPGCGIDLVKMGADMRFCAAQCTELLNDGGMVVTMGQPFPRHMHRVCRRCKCEWLEQTWNGRA